MALRHAAAFVLSAILIQLAGAAAHAQNAPITTPPKIILPPDALPDLVVTKADVSVVCADGHYITATIATTVMNKGKGTAYLTNIENELEASWWAAKGQDFLDGSSKQTIKPLANATKPLKPGESWNTYLVINQIPEYKKNAPKSWEYVFVVDVDLANHMPESNEKNNSMGDYALDPCPK